MNFISIIIYTIASFHILNACDMSYVDLSPALTDKPDVLQSLEFYTQALREINESEDMPVADDLMELSKIIINALTAGFMDLTSFEYSLNQMNGIHDPESPCGNAECTEKEDKVDAGDGVDTSKKTASELIEILRGLVIYEKEVLSELQEDDQSVREKYFENVLYHNFSDSQISATDLEALLVLFIEKYLSMFSELILSDEKLSPNNKKIDQLGIIRWQVLRIRMYIDQKYNMDSKIDDSNRDFKGLAFPRNATLKPLEGAYHYCKENENSPLKKKKHDIRQDEYIEAELSQYFHDVDDDENSIHDSTEDLPSIMGNDPASPGEKLSAIKLFNNFFTKLLVEILQLQKDIAATIEMDKDGLSSNSGVKYLMFKAKDSRPNREEIEKNYQARWQDICTQIEMFDGQLNAFFTHKGINLDISSELDNIYHVSYFYPLPHDNIDTFYNSLVRKYFNEIDSLVSSGCKYIKSFPEKLFKDLLSQIYMSRRLIDCRDGLISGIESLLPEMSIEDNDWVMIDSKDENVKKG